MDNYKSRPKINPKIIFDYLLPDTKKALIIGNNNSDIIEILKQKRIAFFENRTVEEKQLIEYLETLQNKEFSVIILNLELCNYHKINTILKLLVDKSSYSIIRFRNHNVNVLKVSKKKRIKKLIRRYNINIIKKFYGRKNYIYRNFLFSRITYYTVYFITRDTVHLNYEISFTEKIKNFLLSFRKESVRLIINKKNCYGKK
mgnify:CR=1 FL=1